MKRILMVVFAVLMGVSLVTTVFAQLPAEKTDTARIRVNQYTGEVTGMNKAANTLTVKGENGDRIFDVSTVKMEREPKKGEKLVVEYEEKDGKLVATSVSQAMPSRKAEKKR